MSSFSISGEYLTDAAREMVVSGNWRGAHRLLTEDLEGLPYPAVLDILKGQKRLVGRDEITVEDEDPDTRDAYVADVRSVYTDGRLVHAGKRYKIYGKVSRLPAVDSSEWQTGLWKLNTGRERFPRVRNEKETDLREFVRPYCDNPNDDLILPVRGNTDRPECVYALFERDYDEVDLPSWMPDAIPSSAQAAFDSLEGCVTDYGPEPDDKVAADAPRMATPAAREPQAADLVALDNTEWYRSYRGAIAKHQAHAAGYTTIAEYSQALRERVLTAIAERGDTWLDFAYTYADVPYVLRYPRSLAARYALMKTPGRELAPAWEPVSAPDLKMDNDNPTHTDLWLALGFDLDGGEYDHASRECSAVADLVAHLQKTLLAYELHVLTAAGKSAVSGIVARYDDPELDSKMRNGNVLVWVPHAGTEYAVLAAKSAAVLCDVGGRLAHLVIVGREQGIPVVRIPAGAPAVPFNVPVRLDLTTGTLSILF